VYLKSKYAEQNFLKNARYIVAFSDEGFDWPRSVQEKLQRIEYVAPTPILLNDSSATPSQGSRHHMFSDLTVTVTVASATSRTSATPSSAASVYAKSSD
jgi:hypothetical protein